MSPLNNDLALTKNKNNRNQRFNMKDDKIIKKHLNHDNRDKFV